jgi:hypothetical protein
MRKKQNLKARQHIPATSTAPNTSLVLEQQVREHPVVQEVIRLFDARIVSIEQTKANEGARRPAAQQQALCFSSQQESLSNNNSSQAPSSDQVLSLLQENTVSVLLASKLSKNDAR